MIHLRYMNSRRLAGKLPHEQHQPQTMTHLDANPKLPKHHLKYGTKKMRHIENIWHTSFRNNYIRKPPIIPTISCRINLLFRCSIRTSEISNNLQRRKTKLLLFTKLTGHTFCSLRASWSNSNQHCQTMKSCFYQFL